MRDSEPTRGKCLLKWVSPKHEEVQMANLRQRDIYSYAWISPSGRETSVGKMAQRTLDTESEGGEKRCASSLEMEVEVIRLPHALTYYILEAVRKPGPVENKTFVRV